MPDDPLPTTTCGVDRPLEATCSPAGEGRPPSEGGRAEPGSMDMAGLIGWGVLGYWARRTG